jgi:aldehyde dehydrogenase (NAD+)
MNLLTENRLDQILNKQRTFFKSHTTKDVSFRKEKLKKLLSVVESYESEIADALKKDLNKSFQEAYLTEISLVKSEIKFHLKNLKKWTKVQRVSTPIYLLPSRSKIQHEPLGVSLIIAPWNYPFQLVFCPLVGVISSGCCAILKPSADAPNTALLMEKMISEVFEEDYVSVVQGDKEETTLLLKNKFDLIFFTGSSRVGKIVMKAASEFLTPVVLELGGKSPCIVDENANIEIAAKRIAWSKAINAGQTCIAPDYILVHQNVRDELITKIDSHWAEAYGKNPMQSEFYPKIINDAAFERLSELLSKGTIKFGGKTDKANRYIQPTIIVDVELNDAVMKDEIFGPILPVLTFNELSAALDIIEQNEKPLALYYYGPNNTAKEVMNKTSSGGACINDGLLHIVNNNLPFGGVGHSGMGSYRGYEGFKCFSNTKAILQTPTWIDLPFKYPPFKWFNWLKKIV